MKTIVVGAGAMGSLVGGLLAEGGNEVILYDIAQEQVNAINMCGLVIKQGDRCRMVKVKSTSRINELGTADLLIVLVKSYDTEKAIQEVKPCIDSQTLVLTLQNGEGNIEAIMKVIPPKQVLAGVTSHGAMLLSPGLIQHNGGEQTFIGPVDTEDCSSAEIVAKLLDQSGMAAQVCPDIKGMIWTKLIANAAINPLTALLGCRNGVLLKEDNLLEMMRNIVEEGKAVAASQDIKLFQDDIFEYTKSVCAVTGENKSSMLMDIMRGRPTEIQAINGMIVRQGERSGIATPVNQCLTRLIKSKEKTR